MHVSPVACALSMFSVGAHTAMLDAGVYSQMLVLICCSFEFVACCPFVHLFSIGLMISCVCIADSVASAVAVAVALGE